MIQSIGFLIEISKYQWLKTNSCKQILPLFTIQANLEHKHSATKPGLKINTSNCNNKIVNLSIYFESTRLSAVFS